jgi:hypothetical protein
VNVKFPKLRNMRQFVIVALDESDFYKQVLLRCQEGWRGDIPSPHRYPCVMRGYEDKDGWRLVWVSFFSGHKLVCYHTVEYVYGYNNKPYPKTQLAGQMKAQTMGTARQRL